MRNTHGITFVVEMKWRTVSMVSLLVAPSLEPHAPHAMTLRQSPEL